MEKGAGTNLTLEKLCLLELFEKVGIDESIFRITDEGYKIADTIQLEQTLHFMA